MRFERPWEGCSRYGHVLDSETTKILKDSDPFGQVTAGFISLACSGMVAGDFEGYLNHQELTKADILIRHGSKETKFRVSLDCSDEYLHEYRGKVFFLPLSGYSDSAGWSTLEGIVLRRTGNERGQFSRIAYFFQGVSPSEFPLTEAFKEQGATAAEEVCARVIQNDEHAEEKYVINII